MLAHLLIARPAPQPLQLDQRVAPVGEADEPVGTAAPPEVLDLALQATGLGNSLDEVLLDDRLTHGTLSPDRAHKILNAPRPALGVRLF